jgi:N-acetylmuramic acid 6-phosphate etherase
MAGTTEDVNPYTRDIDNWSFYEIAHFIHLSDIESYEAVGREIEHIAKAAEMAYGAIKNGGRVIYVGAGTSGRIAAQDVVELKPTYGMGSDVFAYLMAGGSSALVQSIEGSEDSEKDAEDALKNMKINRNDLVIGITASGSTPFVITALKYARNLGCTTVGITCNLNKPIHEISNLCIELITGPEVIQGSTRMKAGTAQKMTLNIISTAVAIRLGRTYKNTMSNMGSWYNQKLKIRAVSILRQQFGLSNEDAGRILESVDYDISKAIELVKSKK